MRDTFPFFHFAFHQTLLGNARVSARLQWVDKHVPEMYVHVQKLWQMPWTANLNTHKSMNAKVEGNPEIRKIKMSKLHSNNGK